MASFILTDAFVSANGSDISDHVESVEVTIEFEEKDGTAMGATARKRKKGLRTDGFVLNLFQDLEAGEIDAIFWPLVESDSEFTVVVRAKSSAVAANNPQWSAPCLLMNYQPLAGQVGEFAMTQIELPAQAKITRAVA